MSVAQDLFLGIIDSVESGVMTPEEAVTELEKLKQEHDYKSDYTLADFQLIRTKFLSNLLDDEDDFYEEEDVDEYENSEDY